MYGEKGNKLAFLIYKERKDNSFCQGSVVEVKRYFKRYPTDLEVRIKHHSKTLFARLVDYSLDGIGVIVPDRYFLRDGEIVDVKAERLAITAPGEVMWARQDYSHTRLGLRKKGRLEGSITHYELSDALIGLYLTQKTGIFNVWFDDITKKVYMKQGNMIFSSSNRPEDRLGAFLLRNGLITSKQYTEAVDEMDMTGKRLENILVNRGYLSPRQLFDSVREHVEEIIQSLFAFEEGNFIFEESFPHGEEIITLNLSPRNLIYYGAKKISNVNRIMKYLPINSTVYLSSGHLNLFKDINLDETAKRVLLYVDNKNTIKDIIVKSRLEPSEAVKSIYGLLSVRLLTTIPAPPVSTEAIRDIYEKSVAPESKKEIEEIYKSYERLGYYGVLGIKRDASEDEIKKAYFMAVKKFHPDRHFLFTDDSLRGKLTRIFSYINEAYGVLSDPERRKEYDGKVFLKSRRVTTPEDPALSKYRTAVRHFNEQNYAIAETYIKQAIYLDEAKAHYHFLCGRILIKQGKIKEAKSPLQRAVELDPMNPDYTTELGWLYLKAGFKVTANGFFQKALAISPQHKKALRGLKEL